MGNNTSVTYGGGLIPVAQRNVIGASGDEVLTVNEPGTDQSVGVPRFVDVMSVGRSEMPARGPRFGIGEGRHVHVVDVRPSPNF